MPVLCVVSAGTTGLTLPLGAFPHGPGDQTVDTACHTYGHALAEGRDTASRNDRNQSPDVWLLLAIFYSVLQDPLVQDNDPRWDRG